MIYFIQEDEPGRDRVKIGFTRNIYSRIDNIESCSASKVKCVLYFPGNYKTEKYYHEKFKELRIKREWFKYGQKLKDFMLSAKGEGWTPEEHLMYEDEKRKQAINFPRDGEYHSRILNTLKMLELSGLSLSWKKFYWLTEGPCSYFPLTFNKTVEKYRKIINLYGHYPEFDKDAVDVEGFMTRRIYDFG